MNFTHKVKPPTPADRDRLKVWQVMADNGPDVDSSTPAFTRMVGRVRRLVGGDLAKATTRQIYAALESLKMFGPQSDRLRGAADRYY